MIDTGLNQSARAGSPERNLFLMRRDLSAASSVMSEGAGLPGAAEQRGKVCSWFQPTRRNELFYYSASSFGKGEREREREREKAAGI